MVENDSYGKPDAEEKEKVISMPDDRYGRNPSGLLDPTRTKAEEKMTKEENIAKDEKRIGDLIYVLRYISENAGFEIMGRITFVDKHTGKIFR